MIARRSSLRRTFAALFVFLVGIAGVVLSPFSKSSPVAIAQTNSQDLSVTMGTDWDPSDPTGLLVYNISIYNSRPQAATGVTLTDAVPANETIRAVTSTPPGLCPTGPVMSNPVFCDVGLLAPFTTAEIEVTVQMPSVPFGPGLTNTAQVSDGDGAAAPVVAYPLGDCATAPDGILPNGVPMAFTDIGSAINNPTPTQSNPTPTPQFGLIPRYGGNGPIELNSSGAITGRVLPWSSIYAALPSASGLSYGIVFKNSEPGDFNGEDYLMQQPTFSALTRLTWYVWREARLDQTGSWSVGGKAVRARVSAAYDSLGEHAPSGADAHYEGRAVDLSTIDNSGNVSASTLGRLSILAHCAGFDWSFYEPVDTTRASSTHVHASTVGTTANDRGLRFIVSDSSIDYMLVTRVSDGAAIGVPYSNMGLATTRSEWVNGLGAQSTYGQPGTNDGYIAGSQPPGPNKSVTL